MVDLFGSYLQKRQYLTELAGADRRQQQAAQMVTPYMAERAAEIAQRFPALGPGVVTGMAVTDAPDEVVQQAAERDPGGLTWWERAIKTGTAGIVAPGDFGYEQVVKPAVRTAFTALDSLAQEVVQRPLTAGLMALGDETFTDSYRDYGNSTGVVAAKELYDAARDPNRSVLGTLNQRDDQSTEADESFLGTGLFAGGQVAQEQNAQRTLMVEGEQADLGKAFTARTVGAFSNPGDRVYDWTAGISQFAADIFLDPTNVLTGGSTTIAKGIRAVADGGDRAEAAAKWIEAGSVGRARAREALDRGAANELLDEVGLSPDDLDGLVNSLTVEPEVLGPELARQYGAVKSNVRKSAIMEQVQQLIGDPDVVEALRASDFYTINRSMRKAKANVPVRVQLALGRTKDADEVSAILANEIAQGHIADKGFYAGRGEFYVQEALDEGENLRGWDQVKDRTRTLHAATPRGRVSFNDQQGAIDKVDSLLGMFDVDINTRAKLAERIADSVTDDEFRGVVKDSYEVVLRKQLADAPKDQQDEIIRELGEMLGEVAPREFGALSGRAFAVTYDGKPRNPGFARKVEMEFPDGDSVDFVVPTPMHTAQLSTGGINLPDPLELRRELRARTSLKAEWAYRGWDKSNDAARFMTTNVFKPAVLLRAAYIVRIGLEEQARLAASGFDSVLNHPLRFVTTNIKGRDGMMTPAGVENMLERARIDDIEAVARGKVNQFGQVDSTGTNIWTVQNRQEMSRAKFLPRWHRNLAHLSSDPGVRQFVRGGMDPDALIEWTHTKEGTEWVKRMRQINSEASRQFRSDEGIRRWAMEDITPQLHDMTNGRVLDDGTIELAGKQELIEAIGSGRILDEDEWQPLLGKYYEGQNFIYAERTSGAIEESRAKWVDQLFYWVTSKPTSVLARYPAWRQSIIRNVEEMLDALPADMRGQMVDMTVKNLKANKDEVQRLRAAVDKFADVKGGRLDNLEDFDRIVVARASQQAKDLMFDITNRSNMQERYAVTVPFYDAWKEVIETWAGIARQNPAFIYKTMQGYQSMENNGSIYVNDNGEKVFEYPGGQMLANLITGGAAEGGTKTKVALQGRVEGLNLAAQSIGPGFGPMVQMAVGAIPFFDAEGARDLKELINPYGSEVEDPSDLVSPDAIAKTFAPSWAKRLINGFTEGETDDAAWLGTLVDTTKALAISGRYNLEDPEHVAQLHRDAKKGARRILVLRGALQSVGPTGPAGVWQFDASTAKAPPVEWDPKEDPDGHWFGLAVMAGKYYELLDEFNFDSELAGAEFIQRYGVEPWIVAQGKTRSLGALPVTQEGEDWITSNREAADRYQSTIGYFVPAEAAAGEFDFGVFAGQEDRGERERLTGEAAFQLGRKAEAYAIYNAARKRMEEAGVANGAMTEALSTIRGNLEEKFPGWRDPVVGLGQTKDTPEKIRELERAADDPLLADSPATEPLRIFLKARAQLAEAAKARSGSGLGASENADLADALFQVGSDLKGRYPDFAEMWTAVLSREFQ